MSTHTADDVTRAARSTVGSLFRARVRQFPARIAIENADAGSDVGAPARLDYRELDARVARLAGALAALGVARGDRVALLSENRPEYLEVLLASARLGASVACQNWRLTATELAHCIELVSPRVLIVSPRHAERLTENVAGVERRAVSSGRGSASPRILFGEPYERALASATPHEGDDAAEPEDALLILYTSGTTGLPKGAVISHRAEIARNMVLRAEFGIAAEDAFVAWSPLYHMGAAEFSLGTLMSGGTVFVVDGLDVARLIEIVATEQLGWLLLMPGMVGRFAAELKSSGIRTKGVKICGVMADLVPPAEIAEVTRLLGA